MGERSISASERQRQLADRFDRDRMEGTVLNEIRKIPDLVTGSIANHVAEADPHTQYLLEADFASTIASYIVDSIADADTTHAPSRNAVFDALALKAPLASPALTGVPTAPTAALGTNTTQIATMAALQAAIANLVASAPGTLDTLNELATALGNDPNFATTITAALAGKQPLDATLTALAAANWAANALPIGTGADTLAQTAFAANTFPARASTGNLVAKTITDAALSALANMTAYGTFTPTVVGTTTAGTGTYTTQSGFYVRFGPIVFFKLFVSITAHTGTGNLRIGGLPVTSVSDINCPVTIHNANNLALTAGNVATAAVLFNSTQIQIGQTPSGGGAFAGVPLDTAFDLALAGFYFV